MVLHVIQHRFNVFVRAKQDLFQPGTPKLYYFCKSKNKISPSRLRKANKKRTNQPPDKQRCSFELHTYTRRHKFN